MGKMPQKATSVKDKWRAKRWYPIFAPRIFGEVQLGVTPAYSAEMALGRKVETTLYELSGDTSMIHVHLYFKAAKNNGERLDTMFVGHEMSRDYIRSLIRRKSSKVNVIVDVTTKDGYTMRLKGLALTTYRCHRSQRTALRNIMSEVLKKKAQESSFDQFIQDVVFGKLSNDLFEVGKKIYPLRKVEIEKSKVLRLPAQ
ncbi:30S ribosomal protein S3ae [Sulfodiicoccus acidiphilus]|uniref:Small ribosomal subunit protein eS1 n=2 Tax=Sulfodiicoccus acidiphilus TaxID=1670455 RepID=A0A348B0V7_9CREN|nr:30S ribosomal protein S3ae [Sulfodiicoccus acidiphilus]GGT99322.1 30S ribosomal protein S3ae [Sulfodiicoccus acidiphilus]